VPNKILFFSGFSLDTVPILGIIREQQTREGRRLERIMGAVIAIFIAIKVASWLDSMED